MKLKADFIDNVVTKLLPGESSEKNKAKEIQAVFSNLKIKDSLIDLTAAITAKSIPLGPTQVVNGVATTSLALEDRKIGVVIDDSKVKFVDLQGAIGFPLFTGPIKSLGAGVQLFREPDGDFDLSDISANKLTLFAKTEVKLPEGFFLDRVAVTIDNMAPSPPEDKSIPTLLSGTLGIGWGPKITKEVKVPESLGIPPLKDVRELNMEITAATDFTIKSAGTKLTGTIKANVLNDAFAKFVGNVTFDYQKFVLTADRTTTLFNGLFGGQEKLTVGGFGFSALYALTGGLPRAPVFGPIAGQQLGSVTGLAQMIADDDPSNDVLAVWGQFTIPIVGTMTAGIKINLNDGELGLILEANDIPKTKSFDVKGIEDWLMITGNWDNEVSGPVATRIRTPENTFIAEADYAANGITIIDSMSGPTSKTVVIDHPRAGNWDQQALDPTALTNLVFHGYSPNPSAAAIDPTVTTTLGALSGTISADLRNGDPGTRVTFYADTDDTGFDGVPLAATTRDADGLFQVTFDTTLLSAGTYHVYAIAQDRLGVPQFRYGPTTFDIAHRPTDITLDAIELPDDPTFAAAVAENAAPGSAVAILGTANPDSTETHGFSLVTDAGGRFAIADGTLVVGTGAPLDSRTGAPYQITLRATTAHGLTFDKTVTVEVLRDSKAPTFQYGLGDRDIAIGTDGADVFSGFGAGDLVSGRGSDDTLFLAGTRANFFIRLDQSGAFAGQQRAYDTTGLAPADQFSTDLDPPAPYLIIQDLRAPGAAPLVTSGVEKFQFADTIQDASIVPDLACFAAGTRIETATGPIAIEALRLGMVVPTFVGDGDQPIIWIGRRAINCRDHPAPETVWPVRVRAGAFGPGLPQRDLYLSPDHAIFVQDVLIPARLLINGTTIAQVQRDAVTYYHLELPTHAVIRAEWLTVESYLDLGERAGFAPAGFTVRLHPAYSAPLSVSALWEARGAAPLVVLGPRLAQARRAIGIHAEAAERRRAAHPG